MKLAHQLYTGKNIKNFRITYLNTKDKKEMITVQERTMTKAKKIIALLKDFKQFCK